MPSPRTQRFPAIRLKLLLTEPYDEQAWTSACSPDVHSRIANGSIRTRRDLALADLSALLERIDGFGCDYCESWQRGDTIYAETDVRFRSADGASHTIPCVIVARTTHGSLRDLRFHLDPSPIPGWPPRDA